MENAVAGEADGEVDNVEEGWVGEGNPAPAEIVGGVEGECVAACCEGLTFERGRVAAAVGVGFGFVQKLAIPQQADCNSRGWNAFGGVQNMSS